MTSELFRYLAYPFFTTERDPLDRAAFIAIAKLLGIVFLIAIIGGSLAQGLYAVSESAPAENQLSTTEWTAFRVLIACVIAPILEELVFRSWLGAKKGLTYVFPLFVLIWCALMFPTFNMTVGPGFVAVWLVLSGAYIAWLRRGDAAGEALAERLFPILFWISCATFALIHLGNYPNIAIGPLSLLLVFPQLMAGFAFGYIRMRYGFLACVLSHSSWNTALLSMVMLGT